MTQQHCNGQLRLENDGQLEMCFLGTGTAFGRELYQTNVLLIKGSTHVLVDFGMTGPQAIRKLGVDPTQVLNVLPTHSHADHIGGLEYLTLVNRYMAVPKGAPKLKLIIPNEYRSVLWEMSLRGGLEFNEESLDGRRLGFDDLYNTHVPGLIMNEPRNVYRTDFEGISIELFQTNHIPGEAGTAKEAFITYGLYIDDRVFFSGDTKFDVELIDMYAQRSEVLFHDASFSPNPVHACTAELRTLPEDVRKRMYLMHYPDTFAQQDPSDFAGYAQQGMRYIFD